jgi:hypothetical protein
MSTPPERDDEFEPPGLEHLLKALKGSRGPSPDFEVVPEPDAPRPRRRAFSIRRMLILLALGWALLIVSLFVMRMVARR